MTATPLDPGPTVAVLLAAGPPDDPLARRYGLPSKAHLPWLGRTLAGGVVGALRASDRVDRLVYVGRPPTDVGPLDAALPGGDRLADSLALGLGAALALDPVRLLIATADLPWLAAADVARFVDEAPPADFVYPAVRREALEARFPNQRRTFVRLAEGSFTGGNLMLMTPTTVPKLLPFVARIARARKNPLLLSALFGPAVVWGLLRGSVRIDAMERRVSALLGAEARALISDAAPLAADLDRAEDLERAQAPSADAPHVELPKEEVSR